MKHREFIPQYTTPDMEIERFLAWLSDPQTIANYGVIELRKCDPTGHEWYAVYPDEQTDLVNGYMKYLET